MIARLQPVIAAAFYIILAVYIATELYYNRTYWRIVLRKKRQKRWIFLLWIERVILLVLGTITIFLTFWKE